MTDEIVKKPNRFKKHTVKIAKSATYVMFASGFILIALCFVIYARLLWKPIQLEFLQPFLEKIISHDAYQVDLKNAKIISNHKVGLLGVHIDKIVITDKDNHSKHIVRDVTLDIEKNTLLAGDLGLNSVEIGSVTLASVFLENQDTDDNITVKTLSQAFNAYFKLPILKPLRHITVDYIHVPSVDMTLKALHFTPSHHALPYDIHADITLKDYIQTGHIALQLDTQKDLLTADVKNLKTKFATMNGSVSVQHDNQFSLDITTNNVFDGVFYTKDTGLKSIKMQGALKDNNTILDIKDFAFNFKNKVSIKGNADFDFKKGFNDFSYDINGTIAELTLSGLLELWSEKLASGAREWVSDNMTQAQFATAEFSLAGQSKEQYPQKLLLNAPMSQAEFFYLKPMQHAYNVNGRLLLKDKTFIAQVDTGNIGTLNITKASFTIPDICAEIPLSFIEANIFGALKPLLTIIDSKPLNLMQKSGFKYDKTIGDFSGVLTMNFALLKDVYLDDIKMRADVTVRNGALKIGKHQLPLEKINGRLHVTPNNAKGAGRVRLYGIDSFAQWSENFDLRSDVTTDLTLKTSVDDKQLQKLMRYISDKPIPISDYLKGTASLKTHLQLQNNRIKLLSIDGNLNDMFLGAKNSLWHFSKGSPKTVTLLGEQNDNRFTIKNLALNNLKNNIILSDIVIENATIDRAKINTITYKDIIKNMSGHYHTKDNRHLVSLNADKISLIKIREKLSEKTESKTKKIIKYPNILMSLAVKKLKTSDNVTLENPHLIVSRDIHNPHKLYIDIESPMIAMTKVTLQELAFDKRSIIIKTDNAGRLIAGLGIFDNFKDGRLMLNMTQHADTLAGNLSIQKGTILKSPWIAKLLSLASLTGILDRFNSRGLSVDKTAIHFTKINDVVYLKRGTIHGSAIGISFQGNYNVQADNVYVYGSLIPFYGLNSILSDIPIIGKLTSSRKTEGIIGLSYKIDGNTKNPDISVNPLSIFTVGILRRLFE